MSFARRGPTHQYPMSDGAPLPVFCVGHDGLGRTGYVEVYLYDDGVMGIAGDFHDAARGRCSGVPRAEAIERLEAFLAEGAEALKDLREGRRPVE